MNKIRTDLGDDVGLPIRPFMYTIDQVATLLYLKDSHVRVYIHYQGRSVGSPKRDRMVARNIAPLGETPDWRIAEAELVRWLRNRGYRLHETRWVIQ